MSCSVLREKMGRAGPIDLLIRFLREISGCSFHFPRSVTENLIVILSKQQMLPNIGSILGHRLRRRFNILPTFSQDLRLLVLPY